MTGRRRQQVLSAVLLVLAIPCALATTAFAQTYMFNRADYATGPGPVALAVGDFNHDGRMDDSAVVLARLPCSRGSRSKRHPLRLTRHVSKPTWGMAERPANWRIWLFAWCQTLQKSKPLSRSQSPAPLISDERKP